ncbi:PREDICTED: chymotrypsinogen 2-like [Condylura cristata]|uniref:chymotrypsinogen 2-like n=1 Tax=Condylura cristata TaxID=143302 RepID=UPI000643D08C|nr:PREDICTED: chymotrypsinogen 2-like [Condylura cristata]
MALLWLLSCVTLIGTHFGSGAHASDPEMSITPRIINGVQALPGTLPWHAMLQSPSGALICGGSLIHRRWVLTSATCNVTTSDWVVVGMYNPHSNKNIMHRIEVAKVIRHPMTRVFNDIALVKMNFPIDFSGTGSTIILSNVHDKFSPRSKCIVVGWGLNERNGFQYPEIQHEAAVSLLSTRNCERFLGNLLHKTLICAEANGVSLGSGDSGSPLVCRKYRVWTLVGISSLSNQNGHTSKPFVATRVAPFIPWILKTIKHN